MRFRVTILRRARQDQRTIVEYIASRSPVGAAAWIAAFEQMLEVLATAPERMELAEENDAFVQTLRQALFKTKRGHFYRAIFTIVDNEVRILRVRGPQQDLLTPGDVDAND